LLDQPGTTQYYATSLLDWPEQNSDCKGKVKIAMIDTAVDVDHPALTKSQIKVHSVLDENSIPANADHGTAVASILVGSSAVVDHAGLLNGISIIAVNVFRKRGDGIDTNVELLSYAMDKLIGDRVEIINLSFGGPSNKILQDIMSYAQRLGITVVAAAGNGGPGAPPVYPAAYQSTIAVTAIDGANNIYTKANQGSYITLAAPGVDIWLAKSGGGGHYVSGTSYAAPFVTAAFALVTIANPEESAEQSHKRVKREAKDLGQPGHDPIYGFGLVQGPGQCDG
jgi:subtilisin family serine protease